MKRIPRDPEKFEVIDLFDSIGQKHDFKLRDEDSERTFLDRIATSLGRYKTPIILHGRRVEAMFGYVMASLGRCAVIKQEDSGEIIVGSSNINVPDYRVVTREGEQFLIEVKNCNKTNPYSKYSIKATYVEGLQQYANLFKLDLMFAIYWSRWNKWVLISPSDLHHEKTTYVTTFVDSYMQNNMSRLGDITIGTTPPLVFRMMTDTSKPRHIDENGQAAFTIGGIEICCGDNVIIDKQEMSISFYFMLFGDWHTEEPIAKIENDELVAIEYKAAPVENTPGQNFEMVGSMSGMISRYYNELTAPSGQIEKLTPPVNPGSLGITIPSDYKGKQLPLWRFRLQPAKKSNEC